MIQMPDRKLILEDGQEYAGRSFGAVRECILELVFNTSMTGYQEILSDPSYTDQAVVMTYPLAGNYGMSDDDYETDVPSIGALIVRDCSDHPSHFRSTAALGEAMARFGIPGISGIDTRKLTRSIRDRGSRKVMITDIGTPRSKGLALLARTQLPRDAVARVSCPAMQTVLPTTAASHAVSQNGPFRSGSSAGDARFHVVLIDCGVKRSIVSALTARGCLVTKVPWNTSARTILSLQPDGVLVSNGPGDPADASATVRAVRELLGQVPVFGICLGHQIISLAYGASTYKLPFGHRGGNHPVRDLQTGRIGITSQNHSYAVDRGSLSGTPLMVTHLNILDGTVEGVSCERDLAFGVQYHPESAPGPEDSLHLFDCFLHLMEGARHA